MTCQNQYKRLPAGEAPPRASVGTRPSLIAWSSWEVGGRPWSGLDWPVGEPVGRIDTRQDDRSGAPYFDEQGGEDHFG